MVAHFFLSFDISYLDCYFVFTPGRLLRFGGKNIAKERNREMDFGKKRDEMRLIRFI